MVFNAIAGGDGIWLYVLHDIKNFSESTSDSHHNCGSFFSQ